MKKHGMKDHLNLFFSAFLVVAFMVCAYFFSNFTSSLPIMTSQLISIAVFAVFGLLLFYATRVGDGKAQFRLSILTLVVLVLPTLFIIIASLATFMPFHDFFAADKLTGKLSTITALAAVALGYGIPYSFISGFELKTEDEEAAQPEEERTVLEGGIEADLADDEDDNEDAPAEDMLDTEE